MAGMPDSAVQMHIDDRDVRVSNPDKVYFAELGLNIGQVVDYFVSVG